MKTRGFFLNLMSCALGATLLALPAYSEGGAGVRGGEVVDINGKLTLRDLHEQATCRYRTGDDLIAENSVELDAILGALARLDWYFAMELRRELKFLRFCETGPLYPISMMDAAECPGVPSPEPSIFYAYRNGPEVRLDKGKFHDPRYSPHMRALLLIHETMHSYIPGNLPRCDRRLKVMSMVNAIEEVFTGEITKRKDLYVAMTGNQVQFPRSVEQLTPFKAQLEFLLQTGDERSKLLMAAAKPEEFAKLPVDSIQGALAEWDRAIFSRTPLETVVSTIESVMTQGSTAEFQSVFSGKTYERIDPALVATAVFDELSLEKRTALTTSTTYGSLFDKIYASLDQAHAPVRAGPARILASRELQAALGLHHPETLPIASLDPENRATVMPFEARAFIRQLILLVRAKDWAAVERWVSSNPAFYAAFGWHSQLEAIRTLPVAVARERQLDLDVLAELRDALLKEVFDDIRAAVSPGDFAELQARIHVTKFNP